MTPRDDTGAFVVIVSLFDRISDFPGALAVTLYTTGYGRAFESVSAISLCAHIYCCKHLRPIQALAADNKPEFVVFISFLSPLCIFLLHKNCASQKKGIFGFRVSLRKETLFRV